MDTHSFPLFCYHVGPAVAGHVIGLNAESVAANVKALKADFKEWLRNELETSPWQTPDIEGAQLRMVEVQLRGSYSGGRSTYSVPDPYPLRVAAVYGTAESGGNSICFLPTLGYSFYYFRDDQLPNLIEHCVKSALEGKPPEVIHRCSLPSEPWLEFVQVRAVAGAREQSPLQDREARALIEHFAERLPIRRMVQRRQQMIPEIAWERAALVQQLAEDLERTRASILLVGERGAGLNAILNEAIKKVTRNLESAGSRSYWRTQARRFTASAKYLGEWQEQVESLFERLERIGGTLWIEDFTGLFATGESNADDSVAAFLTPLLVQGRAQIIGSLTPQELAALRLLLPAFINQFRTIEVPPLTEQDRVSAQLTEYIESNFKIGLDAHAVTRARQLSKRFYPDQQFPGALVQMLTDCLRSAEAENRRHIVEAHVITEFIKRSGLPEVMLRPDKVLSAAAVRNFFDERILFQNDALDALCDVVLTFKAGLNAQGKPIATLLFAGPTGVGKTAAAKALAEYFFGSGQRDNPLFRLDMSEFQEAGQVHRLIGGRDESSGKLLQHVRARPFSVLLFDEIEKADPVFFDVLLSVLDEGQLTDAAGRNVSFNNCVIIMTSNLGAERAGSFGFGSRPQSDYDDAVRRFFRPEFVNRIGKIVSFSALGREAIEAILKRELTLLGQRQGLAKRNITLRFDDELLSFLAEAGFHPRFGARPLQRAIEAHAVSALARWLLKHSRESNCTLRLAMEAGQVTICRI